MSFKGKSKKGSILDLNKYIDQPIRVKFSGGREGQQHTKETQGMSSCRSSS
jgi:hypothetical protein